MELVSVQNAQAKRLVGSARKTVFTSEWGEEMSLGNGLGGFHAMNQEHREIRAAA